MVTETVTPPETETETESESILALRRAYRAFLIAGNHLENVANDDLADDARSKAVGAAIQGRDALAALLPASGPGKGKNTATPIRDIIAGLEKAGAAHKFGTAPARDTALALQYVRECRKSEVERADKVVYLDEAATLVSIHSPELKVQIESQSALQTSLIKREKEKAEAVGKAKKEAKMEAKQGKKTS